MSDYSPLISVGAFAAGMFFAQFILRKRLRNIQQREAVLKEAKGDAALGISLKNIPVTVYLLGIVAAFVIYLILIIFTIAYNNLMYALLGGVLGIFIAALPAIRNQKLVRMKEKGFREVPPHPALVPYLAFRKETHVGLYIFKGNKLFEVVGPKGHTRVTIEDKPYRIPLEGERGGHIEFLNGAGLRCFMYKEGWSEPLKQPGWNERIASEVKTGLKKIEDILEETRKLNGGAAGGS